MHQVAHRVRQIIDCQTDSIDYTNALTLLDDLHSRKDIRPLAFDTIRELGLTGGRQFRLNCIAFVDFLIKNGNKELLLQLQTSPSILAIGEDPIIRDPHVHQVLCNLVNEWTTYLNTAHIIQPQFNEWKRRLFSFRYRYCLNEQMIAKFRADFSAAYELLSMFNQEIVEAMVNDLGSEDEMLLEILPNVNEIHQRLKELKPTMTDPYVVRIISYLEEYCELCKASYAAFAKEGTFDVDALAEMAGRGIPQPEPPLVDDLLDLGRPGQSVEVQKPPQRRTRRQSAKVEIIPAARPPPDLSGFEFADDVDSGGMSNAEFAAFIDQISKRKK